MPHDSGRQGLKFSNSPWKWQSKYEEGEGNSRTNKISKIGILNMQSIEMDSNLARAKNLLEARMKAMQAGLRQGKVPQREWTDMVITSRNYFHFI